MRSYAILAVTFATAFAVADDKDKPTVREIPTTDLKITFPERAGRATEPTAITSADELARHPVLKDAAEEIKKRVDFATQKLLVFAWRGSGQDKVTLSIGSEGGQAIVYGEYIPGLTRDLRQHVRLFAVPKDLKVVIEGRR